MTCVVDRRGHARAALSGEVTWQSDGSMGRCRLIDVSPKAACLLVEPGDAARIGETISIAMPLAGSMEWLIARDARIVRRRPRADHRVRLVVRRNVHVSGVDSGT